ncbi:MAG: GH3 auxin-responsive promoter family protein, partial [Cytophagales bacterium]|nr:GH3 auxin-responsive promoter family protein [Cytophagales bacterium]
MSGYSSKLVKRLLKARGVRLNLVDPPFEIQVCELCYLLKRARNTYFGQTHGFDKVLEAFTRSPEEGFSSYKVHVPIYTYKSIYPFWFRMKQGEANICWPGKIRRFALTSGTSEGSSKYIPVSLEILRSNFKAKAGLIAELYDNPDCKDMLQSDILAVTSTSSLIKEDHAFKGDISGMSLNLLPIWLGFKPGKKIAAMINWSDRIDAIAERAPEWDIGALVGFPSWCQILLDRIISRHGLKNIHEIWPNLMVFTHGGVYLDTYKPLLEKVWGRPMIYMDVY